MSAPLGRVPGPVAAAGDGSAGTDTHNQTYVRQLYRSRRDPAGEVGPDTWGAAQRSCNDWINASYVSSAYCGSSISNERANG